MRVAEQWWGVLYVRQGVKCGCEPASGISSKPLPVYSKARNKCSRIAVYDVKCVFCPSNKPMEMLNCEWANIYVAKCRAAQKVTESLSER